MNESQAICIRMDNFQKLNRVKKQGTEGLERFFIIYIKGKAQYVCERTRMRRRDAMHPCQ